MQLDIFGFMHERFHIGNRRIYLIELFAGVGCQAKAMQNLDEQGLLPKGFVRHKVVEFEPHCIDSYNAIHGTNFTTMDIRDVHASDLDIRTDDDSCTILFYSFPCTDISLAGKMAGLSKDSGTRSSLLFEVERILLEAKEINKLPQVLICENVPQLISKNFVKDYQIWTKSLEELGYMTYTKVLNAKDYGIPQNRERVFAVSLLNKPDGTQYYYQFPEPIPLKLRLKDMLEEEVDEKYYLSDKQVDDISNWNAYEKPLEKMEKVDQDNLSPCLTTRTSEYTSSMILVKEKNER